MVTRLDVIGTCFEDMVGAYLDIRLNSVVSTDFSFGFVYVVVGRGHGRLVSCVR